MFLAIGVVRRCRRNIWAEFVSEAEKEVFIRGRVPQSIRARFKATCALRDRDMSDVLKELVEKWLIENEVSTASSEKTAKKSKNSSTDQDEDDE